MTRRDCGKSGRQCGNGQAKFPAIDIDPLTSHCQAVDLENFLYGKNYEKNVKKKEMTIS